ncbi:MAG: hypothetical protein K0S75_842 [Clostridia bacterium]|jgi:hypothetical protein|nr:hypothetical protein [Clostridia bacterium]
MYLIVLLLGLLLTPYAVKAAYIQRGYFAVGGELFVPFLFVILLALGKEIKRVLPEHKKSTQDCAQTKIISLN